MTQRLVRSEEGQNAVFEFLRGGADGTAVVGGGDFPELRVCIPRVDDLRMTDWDIAIDFAVDQEDWNCRCGYGIFWRDLIHLKVILQARAEEGHFH